MGKPRKKRPAVEPAEALKDNEVVDGGKDTGTANERKVLLLEAALSYAARGWPVFPSLADAKNKKPLTKHGFKDATTDPNQIRRWWRSYPNALISVPMGAASGLFAVDLDRKSDGCDGVATWERWTAEHPTPETLSAVSPSTGQHRFFRFQLGIRTISLNTLGPGIEIKGAGSAISLAPSRIPGYGEETYKWINDAPIAEAPDWLIEKIFAERPPRAHSEPREPLPDWPDWPDELIKAIEADAGLGVSTEPEDDLDPARIKAALAVIDPDIERPAWIAIGCVLYKIFCYEKGFELWDDWSSRGRTYKAHEMDTQWRSIADRDGYDYNIGTLFYHANEADLFWWKNIESFEEEVLEEPPPRSDEEGPKGPPPPPPPPPRPPRSDEKVSDEPPPRPEQEHTASGAKTKTKLIKTSAEFVTDFIPPDYLINGLLQRRFIYSLTGPTGGGKTCIVMRLAAHVGLGLPLNELEVEQGSVLFLAGENPDDVCMRWIKLCEELGRSPEELPVFFLDSRPKLSNKLIQRAISNETFNHGPLSLVIIDTSAAYFEGENENDAVQAQKHAAMMRSYIDVIGGGPTVIVTCHPTKTPNMDSLLPRGSGGFLAEVDGNLVAIKNDANMTVDVHWHGKFRGPDFAPISFKLIAGTTEKVKDSKGRLLWTVTAKPISAAEKEGLENIADAKRDQLLYLMNSHPGLSIADMAKQLGWFYKNGDPNKSLVQRTLKELKAEKLVEKVGGRFALTPKGQKAAKEGNTGPM
jgi:Bifunctional DNA primase/polymerase, N-terminal/AAA domain/Primase C terminal 2 (PriCT-2)